MKPTREDELKDIHVVFECNGSDELVLGYEERRLEIGLLVEAMEIANRKGVDISQVSIRFVVQQSANRM